MQVLREIFRPRSARGRARMRDSSLAVERRDRPAFAWRRLVVVLSALSITPIVSLALAAPSNAAPSSPAVSSSVSPSASTPTITSFTPTSGAVGTKVTIKGTGLSKATKVSFGSKSTTSFTATSTKITTKVPKGATTGKIKVVTPGGTAVSSSKFKVS